MTTEELIRSNEATLVDVRSFEEFDEETVKGAVNIPLHTIPLRLEEFKKMKQPVICFCRSGNRSHQAVTFLKQHGIEAVNGGSIDQLIAKFSY